MHGIAVTISFNSFEFHGPHAHCAGKKDQRMDSKEYAQLSSGHGLDSRAAVQGPEREKFRYWQ